MSSAFAAQLDADWHYWMRQHPELATQLGYPGLNGRWTDYSGEAIDARAAYLRESLDRLHRIDPDHLDLATRLDYELYRDLVETSARGLDFHNDPVPIRGVVPHNLMTPVNQLAGVVQEVPLTISMMPTATVADYDDLIARLDGVPALVDQTIALLERGLARQVTPPRVALRELPKQIEAQLVDDPLASPLLASLAVFPSTIRPSDRARIAAGATAAFADRVRPAFARLGEFVTGRYVPACRETTGLDALPDGDAMYAFNIRWHTTLDLTPAEIHQVGLEEVARIATEMARVRAFTGFEGTAEAFAAFLRTDSRFYFADANALLSAYRDIAKRADPMLAPLFGRLPQTPYGVLPVPEAAAPAQTTAYYQPGSLTAGRAGQMFANTYKLEARPRWEMEALTLHEAVPGHHLQIAIAQELSGLPEFRKHSNYTAYVEGWALYAEKLGEEMGFYADPYSKYGQLTYEMWRAARLVVDTGLHAMGWSRQRAIDFFAAHTPKAAQDIVVEIDRYIVWPGQALGYKMGELKIRALRARAEDELDGRFDVRAFHDLLLSQGALPLEVLERRVDDWIASQRAR